MNRAEMLTLITRRTGLKRETVKDLMKNGWTFEQLKEQPMRFVSPLGLVR